MAPADWLRIGTMTDAELEGAIESALNTSIRHEYAETQSYFWETDARAANDAWLKALRGERDARLSAVDPT